MKTKIGFYLLSFFTVVLIASISVIMFISITSIRNFSHKTLSEEIKVLEKQSLQALYLNTTRIGRECSMLFNEDINTILFLKDKLNEVYNNIKWYSSKNNNFYKKLIFSSVNSIYATGSDLQVKTLYGADIKSMSLPNNVKNELNALHSLDNVIKEIKNNIINIKYIWLSTASNCVKYYPTGGLKKVSDYRSGTNFTFDLKHLNENFFNEQKNIWTQVFIKPETGLSISIISPVYSNENEFKCVIGVEIDLKTLRSIITPPSTNNEYIKKVVSELGLGKQKFMAVDKKGDLILFTEKQLEMLKISKKLLPPPSDTYYEPIHINLNQSLDKHIVSLERDIKKNKNGSRIITLNGKKYFFAYSKIAFTDLILITYVPAEKLLAITKRMKSVQIITEKNLLKNIVFSSLVLLIIFIAITSFIFNRYFIIPLRILIEGMRSISKGNLSERIKIDRGKELEEAAVTFNSMASKLLTTNLKLEKHKLFLEKTVKKRTYQLATANDQLKKEKTKAINATNAKTNFLANMSHEIRSPMNAILGYSEILLNTVKDAQLTQKVSIIFNNSKNLLNIINDILDLSKIEAGKIELKYHYFDIKTVILDIIELYTATAENNKIELRCNFKSDLPNRIYLDKNKIRQVIVNLLNNALKFTIEGFIEIEVEHERKENNIIDLFFRVKDTGPGVSDDKKDEIFDTFIRLHSSDNVKGSGLGLSISKQLITAMKGELYVTDNPNGGSIFNIKLNNVKTKNQPANLDNILNETCIVDPRSIKYDPASILIIDDEEININIIKEHLKHQTINIVDLNSGKDAIKKAKSFYPDLILIDYKMPGLDGYETVILLRENKKYTNIPVIFITGALLEIRKMQKLSNTLLLEKPFTKETLFYALNKYLTYRVIKPKAENEFQEKDLNNYDNLDKVFIPKDYIEEWRLLKKQFIINRMKTFAEKIKLYGMKNNSKTLILWAEEIISSVNDNNIRKLAEVFNKLEILRKNN